MMRKAEAVAARFPGRIVLGADQVLDCDGTVFHKPADAEAARAAGLNVWRVGEG